jgi:hypothetical protein
VSQEALSRLSPAHHPKPYSFLGTLKFPLTFLAASLPWSALALLSLKQRPCSPPSLLGKGSGGLDEHFLWQALHCWAWPNLIFWSILPEHEIRDCLPIVPAFAGLAALVWLGWFRVSRSREPSGTNHSSTPWRILIGILLVWFVVKAVFVHVVIPGRQDRDLRAKGQQLAAAVPAGEILHLCRLKDEGILFYFGREVRRLADLRQLTSSAKPTYCILTEKEWNECTAHFSDGRVREVSRLRDGQGSPIVLIECVSK